VIRLRYGNRPSGLLDCLAEDIAEARSSPWTTVHVVVPSRHQEGAVKRHLAAAALADPRAASANLKFWFLEELLKASIQDGSQILARPAIQGVLLRRFQTGLGMEDERLDPVRRYLEGPSPGRRRAQLATRLAETFDNYLLSRPAWFPGWEGTPSADAMERCQKHLWSLVLEDLPGWITPREVPAHLDASALPDSLLVFGLGPVATAYHGYLAALSEQVAITLYAQNPCREFWDDTPDPKVRRARLASLRGQLPFDPDDPFGLLEAPPLLRRWGRPGRELLRLLNELGEWDFEEAFQDPGRATLLAALQQDVLDHAPPRPAAADDSLRIHACPTLAREAETIAEEIRALALQGPWRFSDMAVVLPSADEARYLALLRAAFQPGIPVAEAGSGRLADLAEGALALLDLAAGPFTRGRVLALLGHPALRRHFPEGDPDQWAAWCAELGILRGWDRAGLGDAYFDADLLTWDQGLRRLALGAFMGPDPLRVGDQAYEALEMGPGSWPAAGAFIEMLDRLHRDLSQLLKAELPLAAWGPRLAALAGAWLGGDGDRGALAKVQGALGQLAFLEPESLRGTSYPFDVTRELAAQALRRLLAHGLASRPDGVIIGTYGALHGLPFKVVFLPGLGEGKFPSKAAPDDLDLRARKREAGDILPFERDRYQFMETLLGARDRVVISYLDRHPVTGEALAPSPVLSELQEVLRAMGGEPAPVRHTLRRWDADRFRPGGWGHLQKESLAQEVLAAPPPPLLAAAPAGLEPRTVTLSQLRRFLKSPVQGAAAAALGLQEEDVDDSALESETAGTDFLAAYGLRRKAFWEHRRNPERTLEDCYARARAALASRAQAALGRLGEGEVASDLELLRGWDQALGESRPLRTRFGAPRHEREEATDACLPEILFQLQLPGGTLQVRVAGTTEPGDDGATFLPKEAKAPKTLPDKVKAAIPAWVDHLALGASAWARLKETAASARSARLLLPGGAQDLPLRPLAPEAAYGALQAILQDLFAGGHGHLLPVEKVAAGLDYEDYLDWAEDYEPGEFNRISCANGPIPHPETLPPASEEAFLEAQRRLLEILAP